MDMKKHIRADLCLILCGILIWFLADANRLRTVAAEALALCAGSVIPALFPFLAVSSLLIALGFGQWISPLFSGLMGPLFRLPGMAGSAVLLGTKEACQRHGDKVRALMVLEETDAQSGCASVRPADWLKD